MKENGTPTMVKNVSEIKPRFRFEVPGLVGHDPNREGGTSGVTTPGDGDHQENVGNQTTFSF